MRCTCKSTNQRSAQLLRVERFRDAIPVVKNYLRNTIARLEQASFGALVTITDDKRKARIYKIKTELAFADKTTAHGNPMRSSSEHGSRCQPKLDDPLWDAFHGLPEFDNLSGMLNAVATLQAMAPSPDLVNQLHGRFTHHSAYNVRAVPTQYNMYKAGGLDIFARLHLVALCEHQDTDGEDVRPIAGLFCGPLSEVDWAARHSDTISSQARLRTESVMEQFERWLMQTGAESTAWMGCLPPTPAITTPRSTTPGLQVNGWRQSQSG
ncbi:hypothetical protein A1Q2_04880 [Trichosporon asahii var. asahii CBS 8904]|uniref:Uncharacterized protein n=1 Tax=Trichosporon asahii var. asahii (strain CBS 8904) TaxID=1220162 RepID=K1VVA2_TRIAC|nr:hypothetical protein A1Q2_04880 [Trichosporon asahii var. asahii CBS 8904]